MCGCLKILENRVVIHKEGDVAFAMSPFSFWTSAVHVARLSPVSGDDKGSKKPKNIDWNS